MDAFFHYLAANPYILLFLTVGLAVWLGRQTVAGYGLGMVAAAIIIGCGLSVWASVHGTKLELDAFTKSLFYYLFMYGVGLRVGPSFVNSLGSDGIKFTVLAFVSCILGLALVGHWRKAFAPATRRSRRHLGRLADDVGGDRFCRAGRHCGRRAAAAGRDAGASQRDDRALLRHHVHLGHGRHHPDHQVPTQMVASRCSRRGSRL